MLFPSIETGTAMNARESENYPRLKKKLVPDISLPKKSLHYFDALNEREIGR
jgi:hypothetical protein